MVYLDDLGLFPKLREAGAKPWSDYTNHAFVTRLGDGSLPEVSFRHYLGQDYLFLIQFARAYALAAYKSESLNEIRDAAAGMSAIVDTEMALHLEYCADWGLDEATMEALPEASATIAYTRYVLEKGAQGDLLDLYVALAPCVIGYGEIGARLATDPSAKRDENPYKNWIEMYAGEEYQSAARAHGQMLDRLWNTRAGCTRLVSLSQIFVQATQLEADFWEMGLAAV